MLFLKEKEIEPEKIIQIQEQKKYSNSIFSLFNIKKLITASTVLVLVFIIFLSFVFITPVIYGNNETKKQIVNTLVNNYFKCVMKPSFGHQSFARFCNNSCEIIGKCCCGNVNKNCKRGGKQ
jgi:hypothetical protein